MAGQIPAKPYNFPPSDNKIKSSDVNSDFDTLYYMFDPSHVGIYDINIASGADINPLKILGDAIVRTPADLGTPVSQTITAAGQAYNALVLKAGNAAPTKPILDILNSAGTSVSSADYLGNLLLSGKLQFATNIYIKSSGNDMIFKDVTLGTEYKLQDLLASGSAADASATAKGLTKLSLNPVNSTIPIAVGDNDPRIQACQVRAAVSGTALKIDIMAGIIMFQEGIVAYAGATDVAVTDAATNYVQIDSAGTVTVNQTGFTTDKMPLATVVCAAGAITTITDKRPLLYYLDKDQDLTWAGIMDILTASNWKLAGVAFAGTMAELNTLRAGSSSDASALHKHLEVASNSILCTSGEAFSVGDALYLKSSDGKVYKTNSGGAESSHGFIGFAYEAATAANQTKKVVVSGIITGLSGLTAGSTYYTQATAGAIGTAAGTWRQEVGYAITTTSLMVRPGVKIETGISTLYGTTTSTITVGFRVKKVLIHSLLAATGTTSYDSHGSSDGVKNSCFFHGNGGGSSSESYAWVMSYNESYIDVHGVVDTITDTTFRLNQTNDSNNISMYVYWTAIG